MRWRKDDESMSERAEIIFMQVRLIRLASKEWKCIAKRKGVAKEEK